MGSVSPAPTPSDSETYKAIEVQWSMPSSQQVPCPVASSAPILVNRDQPHCSIIYQNLPTTGSVDLRGAKSGNLYAWVPQGADVPLVSIGGTHLQAQFLATDSTAHACAPEGQTDCNVIWLPVSVDFKVDYRDGAPAELSVFAKGPSPTYPAVNFALFENITLTYSASPGSAPIESSATGGATSFFSASSDPPVPVSTRNPAQGSTSQIGATSTGGHHASASVIVPAVLCALFGVAAVTFGVLWWLGRRRRSMAPSAAFGAAFRENPETAWVPIDEKRQHLDGAGPSTV